MNQLRYEKHVPKYQGQEMMEYVANAKFEDLPEEVVTRAKHILLDAVACMLAGRTTRKMFNTTLDFMAEPVSGAVSPIGCELKTNAAMAAFLNAAHAQTHDFNDGLNNSGMLGGAYHPGRTVVSVALSVGQQVHASGKDILLAIVLGVETAARMRNNKMQSYVADCYATAMVAGKLLGATPDQLHAAVSRAAYNCPASSTKASKSLVVAGDHECSSQSTNVLVYGYIARNGVEAAELAMHGFRSNPLDDNNALSTRFATCGLGTTYECMNMYFKPWPCCRKTHGAIEAALALRNEHGVKAEDITAIRIYQQVTGMYVDEPFKPDHDINYGGQFSLQYVVSCAFLDGDVNLKHFRRPDRKAPQDVLEFSKKITVHPDNGLDGHNAIAPNHGILEVDLTDGRTLSMYAPYPLGSEPNGMTEEQRVAKFLTCAEELLSEDERRKWVADILAFDTIETI